MHEEDYGVLWKHHDLYTGAMETRRSRRLVVSSFYTVGNYEYGVFWYFYLDGTIQLEMKLTGIVQTKAIEPGGHEPLRQPRRGGPRRPAPPAPLLLPARLRHRRCRRTPSTRSTWSPSAADAGRRGATPSSLERTAVDQPDGRAQGRRLPRPHLAHRERGPAQRSGPPVGYKLEPHASATLLARPGSPIAQPGGVRHQPPVGHPATTEDRLRPAGDVPEPEPGRRRDRPLGRRRRATSSTPTRSCGTPSARPTWPAPRTGR